MPVDRDRDSKSETENYNRDLKLANPEAASAKWEVPVCTTYAEYYYAEYEHVTILRIPNGCCVLFCVFCVLFAYFFAYSAYFSAYSAYFSAYSAYNRDYPF